MFSKSRAFAKKLGLQWPPIIQAPMAGGLTTPRLVVAVAEAGALGSFATGSLKTEQISADIKEIKSLTNRPFLANVFVPPTKSPSLGQIQTYVEIVNQFRQKIGLNDIAIPTDILTSKNNFQETIDVLLQEEVKVVSFTFGMPSAKIIKQFKKRKIYLIGTANSVVEAKMFEQAGFHAIVAQSYEAGGHRGGFLTLAESANLGALVLWPQIAAAVRCPMIAAGGIMDGKGIVAALILGASVVQLCTAFLAVQESGASKPYRDALMETKKDDTDSTVLTAAYTGKLARSLKTEFAAVVEARVTEIPSYPLAHQLSTELRKQAAVCDYKEAMSMLCGQGVSQIKSALSAAALLQEMRAEVEAVMNGLR